jgi:AcrR family transcriptional regulator
MARPREFVEDDVIEKALRVFWDKGYEGTSLSDLLDATGLAKSSFYKAFESKEGLYRRSDEHYRNKYLAFQREALAEPTPRRIVQSLLDGVADLHTSRSTPRGCFETNGALACSRESEPIRQELVRNRRKLRTRLRDRLKATHYPGSLPPGVTCDEAADFIIGVIQGMAVQAKGGASRNELGTIIRLALLAWPKG